jgi:hypothetical protein
MSKLYECDRCKKHVSLIFHLQYSRFSNDFHANLYCIYYGIKNDKDLCEKCLLKLHEFMENK